MKRFNNYILVGLLFNVIFLIGNGLDILPEFIRGFCCGLGIFFIGIGIYAKKHDLSKFRQCKQDFIKHIFSK